MWSVFKNSGKDKKTVYDYVFLSCIQGVGKVIPVALSPVPLTLDFTKNLRSPIPFASGIFVLWVLF